MRAILSCTADDLYSFSMPFAVYGWKLIGVDCIVFVPMDNYDASDSAVFRLGMAMGMCSKIASGTEFRRFVAPPEKVITYAQCIRLYAAAHGTDADIFITSDADMCVFNGNFWQQFDYNGAINIIGSDLVPEGQVPMCYIAAPVVGWRHFMQIGVRSAQQCVDDLLAHLEAEHFRGNYWSKDQETAYHEIHSAPYPIVRHNRAKPGTQFATCRADRDGWHVTHDIIDAHLPRPGWTPENFAKIKELFAIMYPETDHSWMDEFHAEFENSLTLSGLGNLI